MSDDSKLIPLTKGCFATVDAADYEWLSRWKWTLMVNKAGNKYACGAHSSRRVCRSKFPRKISGVLLRERHT